MDPSCHVTVPEGLDGPAPLLLALHGKGDNGYDFLQGTGLGRARAIVAAPTGSGLAWAPAPYARTSFQEDKERIDGILDDLIATHNVDTSRIYIAGFSNGGGLAVELSLHSDRFAGVATVSAAVRASAEQIAQAPNPVDYLNIHGTYDDVVPYEGEQRSPYSGVEDDVIQPAPDVVAGFERRNGDAARTEHRRVEKMGHEWPTGAWARDIDLTEEIFDFFGLQRS